MATTVALAVIRAACAARCAVLTDARAAACEAFAACAEVLIAAFEVACAVFTVFWVVLTVPLAAVLTVLFAFRAVPLTVLFACCAAFPVWAAGEWDGVPYRTCVPACLPDIAFSALRCLKSAILSFAFMIFSFVSRTPFRPCLSNWWMPSFVTRSAEDERRLPAYSDGELSSEK